jgi:ubiquinone/menaquinone biosynthesis C-methylase UbiE
MGFYSDRILPHLIRLTMRGRDFVPYRERTLATAAGRVLEVGIGSGENLPRYGSAVTEVIGLEPSARLAAMARAAAKPAVLPVTIMELSAEKIPLDAQCVDTAVMTWTLCSIANPTSALREIRRVLKPEGRLLFVEHGLAPDRGVRDWQRRLTPLWKRLAGGCHLDRDMPALISSADFKIDRLATGYMRGPRPMTFMYEGTATRDTR